MLENKKTKLLNKLNEIHASIEKKPIKVTTIERRVGRWLGEFKAVSRYYTVEVLKDRAGNQSGRFEDT